MEHGRLVVGRGEGHRAGDSPASARGARVERAARQRGQRALLLPRYSPDRHPYGSGAMSLGSCSRSAFPLALAARVMALLNIDYVVIGAELGTVQLGFYCSLNLCSWPVNMFSALPDAYRCRCSRGCTRGRRSLSAFVPVCTVLLLVTLPACLVLPALAEPVVAGLTARLAPRGRRPAWIMVLASGRVLGELCTTSSSRLRSSSSNLTLQVV